MWGLYPALKSSHINFQLNRTTHGGAAASPKWPFLTSKGTPCDFWPFFERPPKRHFWALWGALVCLDRFFSSFWPRTCIFRNLFGPFKSDLLTRRSPFLAGICSGKKVVKSADLGSKKLKFQTNCWKCTQMVKISWLRNLVEILRFWSKIATFGPKSQNIEKSPFFKIFENQEFRRFADAPPPPWAVRLSWKLCEGSILP